MNQIVFINSCSWHYEILESIIEQYDILMGRPKEDNDKLLLACIPNKSFFNYIKVKYPEILVISYYKYKKQRELSNKKNKSHKRTHIICTSYPKTYEKEFIFLCNPIFIMHRISNKLKNEPNIFFVSPLSKSRNIIRLNYLPYKEQKKHNDIPIFIVQGRLLDNNRNYSLLAYILENTSNQNFLIKLVGSGSCPDILKKYVANKRIELCLNLNFEDYHSQFLDAYGILTLTSVKKTPKYYSKTLTSSINYADSYDLVCITDTKLYSIYKDQLRKPILYNNSHESLLTYFNNIIINKILVCFMSCKKNNNIWEDLLNYKINSLIFYGDPEMDETFTYKDRILSLKCKDTYDHLPFKVYSMIKAVLNIPEFNNITHIYKIDDWDTKINNNIHNKLNSITLTDYCGQRVVDLQEGNRRWHFNKCPLDSIWNNKEYSGTYTPWLDGGSGYILSRKAMNVICKEDKTELDIHTNHIYEDIMIAKFLHENGIHPSETPEIIKCRINDF